MCWGSACALVFKCLQRPGCWILGTIVIGSCEQPGVGAGNQYRSFARATSTLNYNPSLLVHFLIQPRAICPGSTLLGPPISVNDQENASIDRSTGQYDGRTSSVEVPSSRGVKFTVQISSHRRVTQTKYPKAQVLDQNISFLIHSISHTHANGLSPYHQEVSNGGPPPPPSFYSFITWTTFKATTSSATIPPLSANVNIHTV